MMAAVQRKMRHPALFTLGPDGHVIDLDIVYFNSSANTKQGDSLWGGLGGPEMPEFTTNLNHMIII